MAWRWPSSSRRKSSCVRVLTIAPSRFRTVANSDTTFTSLENLTSCPWAKDAASIIAVMLRQVPLGLAAAMWLAASPAIVHRNNRVPIVSLIRAAGAEECGEVSDEAAANEVTTEWAVVRNNRFVIYSQDGEATARKALQWCEQLRAAARQETGVEISGRGAVRVIGFSSVTDYSRYRVSPTADA